MAEAERSPPFVPLHASLRATGQESFLAASANLQCGALLPYRSCLRRQTWTHPCRRHDVLMTTPSLAQLALMMVGTPLAMVALLALTSVI